MKTKKNPSKKKKAFNPDPVAVQAYELAKIKHKLSKAVPLFNIPKGWANTWFSLAIKSEHEGKMLAVIDRSLLEGHETLKASSHE